jgi:ABC-type uncharacterized transport system permease subunit
VKYSSLQGKLSFVAGQYLSAAGQQYNLAKTCQQPVSKTTWPKPVSSWSAKQPGQNLSAAGQQNNLVKTCQQPVSKTTWSKPVSSRSAKQPGCVV